MGRWAGGPGASRRACLWEWGLGGWDLGIVRDLLLAGLGGIVVLTATRQVLMRHSGDERGIWHYM